MTTPTAPTAGAGRLPVIRRPPHHPRVPAPVESQVPVDLPVPIDLLPVDPLPIDLPAPVESLPIVGGLPIVDGERAGTRDDPLATAGLYQPIAPPDGGYGSCHGSPTATRHRTVADQGTTPAHLRVRELPGVPSSMAVTPRLKPTGVITHAPKRPAVRAAPATPVSAPVSGSGESDCAGGKTPTGAGDVTCVSLRAPGLWSIARRLTVRAGRYVAGKPSFSPD